jgi:serine/threonine-protein kinase
MQQVGRYAVLAELGRGRFGTVYLGRDRELDRPVALKALAAELTKDPLELGGFRQEAAILAGLAHPNVVKVYDFLEGDGGAWIVEEFIDGASLRRVVEASGRLSPEQALGVVRGALVGLEHVHHAGVLHRDIQPANVMADRDGTSRLVDFGQAGSAADRPARPTGSPAYVAPEVVAGRSVDARADVYSTGCVLYELLTGAAPFAADNVAATLRQHLQARVPRPAGVPRATARVVTRAMAKDPADRQQSAGQMLAELEEASREDYGADWLTRASLAAMAAAAAGGAAVISGAGTTVNAASTIGPGAGGTATVGSAGTSARATSPLRIGPLAGAGAITAAAVAILVAAVLASIGVLAVSHSGRFTPWYAAALTASCPTVPSASAGAAPSVTCNRVLRTSSGEAVQVSEVRSPTTIPLGFGFCSGQTCGDADPECLSDLYIPQFGAALVTTLTVATPPGATPSDVAVAASRSGRFQPIEAPSTNTAGDHITVKLNTPLAAAMQPHFKVGRGYCGFNAAQVKALHAQFGNTYDNRQFAVLRLIARWKFAGPLPSPGAVKLG